MADITATYQDIGHGNVSIEFDHGTGPTTIVSMTHDEAKALYTCLRDALDKANDPKDKTVKDD